MADKKRLFSSFAKKLSELSHSKPKIRKTVFRHVLPKPNVSVNNSNLTTAPQNIQSSEPLSADNADSDIPSEPENQQDPQPGSSKNNISKHDELNLFFENSVLKAYIERGIHKREKKFAMHDHLFYIKVEPKKDSFPMLINILDFLEEACNYILNKLKDFYKVEDNNICFLTVFQSPMLNGALN